MIPQLVCCIQKSPSTSIYTNHALCSHILDATTRESRIHEIGVSKLQTSGQLLKRTVSSNNCSNVVSLKEQINRFQSEKSNSTTCIVNPTTTFELERRQTETPITPVVSIERNKKVRGQLRAKDYTKLKIEEIKTKRKLQQQQYLKEKRENLETGKAFIEKEKLRHANYRKQQAIDSVKWQLYQERTKASKLKYIEKLKSDPKKLEEWRKKARIRYSRFQEKKQAAK